MRTGKLRKVAKNTWVDFAFLKMPHMLCTFDNLFVVCKLTAPVKYQTVLVISLHPDLQTQELASSEFFLSVTILKLKEMKNLKVN